MMIEEESSGAAEEVTGARKYNADYIQLWHGDASLLRESLEAVQQTAAVILGGIAPEPAALAAAA